MFRALALRRSESALALRQIRFDEGLTLETSAAEFLCCGQFTLSTQLIKPDYLFRQSLRANQCWPAVFQYDHVRKGLIRGFVGHTCFACQLCENVQFALLVPRPQYYASVIRFGSRGPGRIVWPRQA